MYATRSHPSLIYPVTLALHLAGLSQPQIHAQARRVLADIGLVSQVRQDYHNCFTGNKSQPANQLRM